MIKQYYYLTKPGIVYGNAITAAAGFFLASKTNIDFGTLAAMAGGISLVMAGSCVLNNYLDRDIDARMGRTQKRSLVTGRISNRNALIYAAALLILGSWLLSQFTNFLTLAVALAGSIVYVGFYTPLKRRSVFSTLVGSIAGAVPPVVGYTAVTNRLDAGAWILFLILVCWQMPHFYAIGIFRRDDYANAELPILSVKHGVAAAKRQIIFYMVGFLIAASLLKFFGYGGYTYLAIMVLAGLGWLLVGARGFKQGTDDKIWARQVFKYSLWLLLTLYAALLSNLVLP